MNKANFNDMFKSILIILLFIIIIGLIWITTNPKLIKDMICNVEGFTSDNTINQCNRCYITPFNVSGDNNRIDRIIKVKSNRIIYQHNFYFIDNDISYLFTTWKHDRNFNENCTTVEERDRNRPCCLTDDSINQSNFYKSNYIDITLDNTRIRKFGTGRNMDNPIHKQEADFLSEVRDRLPNKYDAVMTNITMMTNGKQKLENTKYYLNNIFGQDNKDLFNSLKN